MSFSPSKHVQSFAGDRRGTMALMIALTLPLVMLCVGIAVDTGRWYGARKTTSSAIDAAVLAGARALQLNPSDPNNALTVASQVYAANVKDRTPLLSDGVNFAVADNGSSIVATGDAKLGTTFLAISGIADLDVVGAAKAKAMVSVGGKGGSNIEIAVMLDLTGSMCDNGVGPCNGGNKMDGLKAAAKDLVEIAVSADQSKYTSKVSLIPFSTRVRVGPDGGGGAMMKALTNLDATWNGWFNICKQSTGGGGSEDGGNWACQQYASEQQTNWKVMPCVTDRFYNGAGGFDATDDTPGANRWLNAHGGDRMILSSDSTDQAPTSKKGLQQADPADNWNYDPSGSCADVDEKNQMMPLTANKSALKSRINDLVAYGATAGALGTAWASYTLSPNWSTVFAGASAPASYGDLAVTQASGAPLLRKVAVLMTDGGYNTYRGWKGQNQQAVSNYALQVCSNMKARGIEVYTVGFALDQLPANERTIAEATLKACGTDLQHFYDTLNVSQLQAAFRDIALQLTSIYMSE